MDVITNGSWATYTAGFPGHYSRSSWNEECNFYIPLINESPEEIVEITEWLKISIMGEWMLCRKLLIVTTKEDYALVLLRIR